MTSDKPIHYGRQWLDGDDIEAVVGVLKGGWLTQGPAVAKFEDALADYCGAKHAVAVANGTAALHLACLAGGIGPGDEGMTTPLTFVASANCLVYCGAKPVFADIEPDTWNIDCGEIERKIVAERTKVLIPVHFAGLPCDLERLRSLADRHRLLLIEDACHALGAEYRGKRIGGTGLADMTCFSFHPVKNITTGEGGAVLTDDATLAGRLRRLRHHGLVREEPEFEHESHGVWYHEMQTPGYNARLSDIHSALGLSQLCKLDGFQARRQEIASRYRQEFSSVQGLTMQAEPSNRKSALHLFIVHLDPTRHDRNKVMMLLKEREIHPQVHYIPVHLQPYFRRTLGTGPGDFPNSEQYYDGCLSLPLYPALEDSDLDRVVEEVCDILV